MRDPIAVLKESGHRSTSPATPPWTASSACRPPRPRYLLTDCSLICLARTFDELDYAGNQNEDAA